MLTVEAPAKINLVLEVLGKDGDHHRISSIIQTISLYDVLKFQLAEGISFECSEPDLVQDNLVVAAAMLLRKTAGCSKGVQIELHKSIPWGKGLGGGSSDAAATLLTLNRIWEIGMALSDLAGLAFELGSDVPFFIYGGTALVEGKGEKVTPLQSLHPTWFVLLLPPVPGVGNKTRQLYSKLDASCFTGGGFVQRALASLSQGEVLASNFMFNAFDRVAFDFFPGLCGCKISFEEAGASSVHLTGSGPCLFTPVYEKERADNLCLRLRNQGLECYVAASLSSVS